MVSYLLKKDIVKKINLKRHSLTSSGTYLGGGDLNDLPKVEVCMEKDSDAMFNKEQLEYTKWLKEQPRKSLCECGWNKKDECRNTHRCEDARRNAVKKGD